MGRTWSGFHNRVRVLVLRYVILVPAVIVVGGWILLQLWEGLGSFSQFEQREASPTSPTSGQPPACSSPGYFTTGPSSCTMNESRDGWFKNRQTTRSGAFHLTPHDPIRHEYASGSTLCGSLVVPSVP